MATLKYFYAHLKPMLIQARDREEAEAQAMRMLRQGYPFKIAKCCEVDPNTGDELK